MTRMDMTLPESRRWAARNGIWHLPLPALLLTLVEIADGRIPMPTEPMSGYAAEAYGRIAAMTTGQRALLARQLQGKATDDLPF